MGKLANALLEWRSSGGVLANPPGWMIDLFGSGPSKSGVSVNADTAMQASAVFACVRVIAETVGCTPLILYERLPDGSKQRATSSTVYRALHESPNEWQTPSEFKEMMTGHAVLRGNAYAYIDTDGRGGIRELIPLHPDRMQIIMSRARPAPSVYRYTDHNGVMQEYRPSEIFHLRGLSSDGIVGLSLSYLARENIGLSLAAEEHASRTFSNGASIRGVLKSPGLLKQDAFDRLKRQFNETYAGLSNSGKTAILEGGVEWQQIGMTSKDAEFLELRKFQISDIARIFRVPPHLIGDLEKATFSNIEQQSLEFITYTMLPWFVKWEEACDRDLFLSAQRGRYFVEALTDNFVRGDIKTRYEAYSVARNNGWLSVNEIREKENFNNIGPEGDIRLAPMNYIPLGDVGKQAQPPVPAPPPSAPKRNNEAIRIVFEDAARRIVLKEINAIKKAAKGKNGNGFGEVFESYAESQDKILGPLLRALDIEQEEFRKIEGERSVKELGEIKKLLSNSGEELDHLLVNWQVVKPSRLADGWMKLLEA